MKSYKIVILLIGALVLSHDSVGQQTEIKGFANVDIRYTDQESSPVFYLGEQDLFITSQISDRVSFLGESVFKFSPNSPTKFNVSIERLIVKINFKGNHSFLLGKHHTPLSHWNDKYHHGRVFFPTVDRPLLFRSGLIEIHTTGLIIQGLNLGDQKFGYQLMVGNGIGSNDLSDDNASKSLTLEAHIKPKRGMKAGVTAYMDKFSSDAIDHHADHQHNDSIDPFDISQIAGGVYFRYFRNKLELLTEAHIINNDNDSVGITRNNSFYAYAGYRVTEKIVPYAKFDMVNIDNNELYFTKESMQSISIGVRYEFNHLAVAKLEYNLNSMEGVQDQNGLYLQLAIGF